MKPILLVYIILHSLSVFSADLNAELSSLYGQQNAPVLIRRVTLLPMDSSAAQHDMDVLIRNGKIHTISPYSPASVPPKNTAVIDGTGKYLLPGYIDCHVHFSCMDDIWLFLANGVTSVRVMSGSEDYIALKRKIQSRTIVGPQMFVSSPVFEDKEDSYYDYIESEKDCINAVQESKNMAYDCFKVGNISNRDYFEAVAKKCDQLRYPLVGHCPTWASAAELNAYKLYTLEHLLYFPIADNKAINALAQSKIWLCPTLSIYTEAPVDRRNWTSHPQYRYLHKSILKEWEKYPKIYTGNTGDLSKIYALWQAGANIVAGTDCRIEWVVPGFSIHSEIGAYCRYGIPPMEALRIATANGADMLNISNKTGRIRTGLEADLVLLNSDPLANIAATSDIEAVFCDGIYLSKKDIDSILARIEQSRK